MAASGRREGGNAGTGVDARAHVGREAQENGIHERRTHQGPANAGVKEKGKSGEVVTSEPHGADDQNTGEYLEDHLETGKVGEGVAKANQPLPWKFDGE